MHAGIRRGFDGDDSDTLDWSHGSYILFQGTDGVLLGQFKPQFAKDDKLKVTICTLKNGQARHTKLVSYILREEITYGPFLLAGKNLPDKALECYARVEMPEDAPKRAVTSKEVAKRQKCEVAVEPQALTLEDAKRDTESTPYSDWAQSDLYRRMSPDAFGEMQGTLHSFLQRKASRSKRPFRSEESFSADAKNLFMDLSPRNSICA